MVSPTPLWQFIAGQILGGSLRGLYAGGVILLLTFPIRTDLTFSAVSILILFLNGMVFSTITLTLSFLAKSCTDAPRYPDMILRKMAGKLLDKAPDQCYHSYIMPQSGWQSFF